jgi:hypothetical protein
MQSIKNTRESAELTLPLPTRKMEVDSSIEHTVTKRYVHLHVLSAANMIR